MSTTTSAAPAKRNTGIDIFSSDHNEITIPELYYLIRRFVVPQDHLQGATARRNYLMITGPSGVGKTAIALSIVTILNQQYLQEAQQRGLKQAEWTYAAFFQNCAGLSKHSSTIPYIDKGTLANPKEQATLEELPLKNIARAYDWIRQDPTHRAILSLDELLSCADVGFQTALIPFLNEGSLGNITMTPEEFSRVHILATGNTAEDGNPAVKVDRFALNRFSTCRLVPTRSDFLEFVVKPGIVNIHPLVANLLSSEIIDKYWLQRFGPHEINPRTIEAVSQVVTGLADPMTGMLPTPDTAGDSSAYRETEIELRTKIPAPLVTELMASNEAMKGITPINDIVADPENCAMPQGGPMAQLMQSSLIDSYLKTGSMNNLTPWYCLPHIALFCGRLDAVVQPSISAVSSAVRSSLQHFRNNKVDAKNKPAIQLLDMFDGFVNQWRSTTINDNLQQRFQHKPGIKIDSRVFDQNFKPKQEAAKKQLRTLASGNPLEDKQVAGQQMHVRMPDLATALGGKTRLSKNTPDPKVTEEIDDDDTADTAAMAVGDNASDHESVGEIPDTADDWTFDD